MRKYIIDASSFLILINQEEGYQLLEKELSNSLMSVVSILEIADVLHLTDMPSREIFEIVSLLSHLLNGFIEFGLEQTMLSVRLNNQQRSIGERASISLAYFTGFPLLTGRPL